MTTTKTAMKEEQVYDHRVVGYVKKNEARLRKEYGEKVLAVSLRHYEVEVIGSNEKEDTLRQIMRDQPTREIILYFATIDQILAPEISDRADKLRRTIAGGEI